MTKEEQLAKIASADELTKKGDFKGALKVIGDIKTNIDFDKEIKAKHLFRLAIIYNELGKSEKADDVINKSLEILENFDDEYSKAVCLYHKGLILVDDSKMDEAKTLFDEALADFKKLDDGYCVMHTYYQLARYFDGRASFASAIDNYNMAIREAELLNDNYNMADFKKSKARCVNLLSKENIEETTALLDEAYDAYISMQKNELAVQCLFSKAIKVYDYDDSLAIANRVFDEALAKAQKYGLIQLVHFIVHFCETSHIQLKAISNVVISDNLQEEVLRADNMCNSQLYEQALSLYKDIKRKTEDESLSAQCVLGIARVALLCRNENDAEKYVDEVISQFEKDKDYLRLGHCYNIKVNCLIRKGKKYDNIDNITKAIECYRKCGSEIDEANSLLDLIDARLERGEYDGLIDIADRAYKIFEKNNDMFKIGHTLYYYGLIYFSTQNLNSANKYFAKGAEISEDADDSDNMIKCLINCAKTGHAVNMDIDKIKELLQKAYDILPSYDKYHWGKDIDELCEENNIELDID